MKITVTCPCGQKFSTTSYRLVNSRGKYCSRPCQWKYKVVTPNDSWIKKGEHRSIDTQFKSETTLGEKNAKWKGNKVGYFGLHTWVTRKLGKAIECQDCGSTRAVQWANKSHEYQRDISDWLSLCKRCHGKYDSGKNWGIASRIFDLQKTGARHG